MSFLDKPTLSADNGSFFRKNLVYQTEKPTLSEINLLYLIIVTTACHRCAQIFAAWMQEDDLQKLVELLLATSIVRERT